MFIISYERGDEGCKLAYSLKERTVPSDLVMSQDGKSFYVGCNFGKSDEELFESGWELNPNVLNKGCSALYIVRFDEQGCTFATDTTGRELLFYYHDERRLVLSDSFWGILAVLEPNFDDLDTRALEVMVATGARTPSNHSTPVKGVTWLAPNTICTYDAQTGELKSRCFDSIARIGEVTDLWQAVEGMDEAMRRMAHYLAERHANKRFGLGLSGGLDSRVALHYLKQEGIDPICFNVGVRRPHGVLEATSARNARRLAKMAETDITFVEWNPNTIREKADLLLENQPLTPGFSNLYKYESDGRPNFDVLVTAGHGIGPMIVGVSAAHNSDTLSKQDIYDYLFHLDAGDLAALPYTQWLVRGKLRSMGISKKPLDCGPEEDVWRHIVSPRAYQTIADWVRGFVDRSLEDGLRPADVTMTYRVVSFCASGRNGAYESGLGTEKSYTVYTPFLVREGLRWDPKLVEDRLVLKELIRAKAPEFSEVGEETYGTVGSSSALGAALGKLGFVIRGSGIMAEEWHAKNSAIREAFAEDMTNASGWFYELFPAAKDWEAVWRMSPPRKNSVWLVKRLVDAIESRRYWDFARDAMKCMKTSETSNRS